MSKSIKPEQKKSKVKESLLNATEQLQACQSNGTARSIVIDAYNCIDSCWSAIDYFDGQEPSRIHKTKLEGAFVHLSESLKVHEITKNEIETLYKLWLNVRYSQKSVTPVDAYKNRLIAQRVYQETLNRVSALFAKSAKQLEEDLFTDLLGGRYQAYEEALGWLHEKYQQEIELEAEMGHGSKLGGKIANISNYCDLALISDDETTRKILAEDESLNDEVIILYDTFISIVSKLQEARYERKTPENDVPNFNLGLKIRYTGASIEEIGERWGKMLTKAFSQIILPSQNEKGEES